MCKEFDCLPSEAEHEWNNNRRRVLQIFMVRDFENAMDAFRDVEEKDRPEHWMFDLIIRLEAVELMGEELVAEMMGEA